MYMAIRAPEAEILFQIGGKSGLMQNVAFAIADVYAVSKIAFAVGHDSMHRGGVYAQPFKGGIAL